MNLEELKAKLTEFGTVEKIEAGETFKLLVKKNFKDDAVTLGKMMTQIRNYSQDKYDKIVRLVTDGDYFDLELRKRIARNLKKLTND